MSEEGDINIVRYVDGVVEKTPVQKNIEFIKNKINIVDHPCPTSLMAIAAAVVLFMYYLYVVFIKTDFGGTWYGPGGEAYVVSHNKYSDGIVVNGMLPGYACGGAMYIDVGNGGHIVGAVDKNTIYWARSDIAWTRPVELMW